MESIPVKVINTCRICEHQTFPANFCIHGVRCDDYGKLHHHCMEGCFCSWGGCWAECVNEETGEII